MKPQRAASGSAEPLPRDVPRRGVSAGCGIPPQATRGPRRVPNKHRARAAKCSEIKRDKAKSYGSVPREVSPLNIPLQIYSVATLLEICNGKAFPLAAQKSDLVGALLPMAGDCDTRQREGLLQG